MFHAVDCVALPACLSRSDAFRGWGLRGIHWQYVAQVALHARSDSILDLSTEKPRWLPSIPSNGGLSSQNQNGWAYVDVQRPEEASFDRPCICWSQTQSRAAVQAV